MYDADRVPFDAKDPQGFYYSPSQLSTFRDCARKWYYERTLGRPRKDTKATLFGKEVHAELEGWLKGGPEPTNDRARALMPLLPPPAPSMLIEHPILLDTPPGRVKAFADLLIPRPELIRNWPESLRKIASVFDHKTTANLFYAKTDEALKVDPQALIYGLALRVLIRDRLGKMPDEVQLVWNYTQSKKNIETAVAKRVQSTSELEDGLVGVFADAESMKAYLIGEAKPEDVPCRTAVCTKYGGCEFVDVCPDAKRSELVSIGSKQEVEVSPDTLAMLAKLKKNREAAPAAPAATPSEPAQAAGTTAPEPSTETPEVTEPSPEPTITSIDSSEVPDKPSGNAQVAPPDAPKRPRGRPKGSKNAPKAEPPETPATEPPATPAFTPFEQAVLDRLDSIQRALSALDKR